MVDLIANLFFTDNESWFLVDMRKNKLLKAIEEEFFGFKPIAVCNCGKFKPGIPDYNCLWVECENCGNWRFFRMDKLVELYPNGKVPKRFPK